MTRWHRRFVSGLGPTAALAFALLVPAGAPAEEQADGRQVFLDAKCNLCHAVPAVDIPAKTKSEKLKGPDLGGPLPDGFTFADLAAYLRKETDRDGVEHKKEFKGTDEELQTIVDWLGSLEAAPETDP